MATQYTSKIFTSFEGMNKSFEENYKKLEEQTKAFADGRGAPVKKYVESLQSIYSTLTTANKELLAKTTGARENAVSIAKQEFEKTSSDLKVISEKAKEEMKSQLDKRSERFENSLNIVKSAADDIKKSFTKKEAESDTTPVKKVAKKTATKKSDTEDKAA